MARVRLDAPVNSTDYGITTCAALLDNGHAIVERVEHFGRNDVTKYFVTLLDLKGAITSGCFEIGQKAYESRAAKGQDKLPAPAPDPLPLSVTFEGGRLIVGLYQFAPSWDQDSESWEISISATHPQRDALIAALRSAMADCEVNSALYGETLVINFFPYTRVIE